MTGDESHNSNYFGVSLDSPPRLCKGNLSVCRRAIARKLLLNVFVNGMSFILTAVPDKAKLSKCLCVEVIRAPFPTGRCLQNNINFFSVARISDLFVRPECDTRKCLQWKPTRILAKGKNYLSHLGTCHMDYQRIRDACDILFEVIISE